MPFGRFLPGFQIYRASRVSDGAGGWTESFVLASTVSGALSPTSRQEAIRGDQVNGIVTHRFSTSSGTDIKVGDQVRKNGVTVTVNAVGITSQSRRKECLCEEVNAG